MLRFSGQCPIVTTSNAIEGVGGAKFLLYSNQFNIRYAVQVIRNYIDPPDEFKLNFKSVKSLTYMYITTPFLLFLHRYMHISQVWDGFSLDLLDLLQWSCLGKSGIYYLVFLLWISYIHTYMRHLISPWMGLSKKWTFWPNPISILLHSLFPFSFYA